MNSIDIINTLNPDMMKCPINHEWVDLNGDDCLWFTAQSSNVSIDKDTFWKCWAQCPKLVNTPNNIIFPFKRKISDDFR